MAFSSNSKLIASCLIVAAVLVCDNGANAQVVDDVVSGVSPSIRIIDDNRAISVRRPSLERRSDLPSPSVTSDRDRMYQELADDYTIVVNDSNG